MYHIIGLRRDRTQEVGDVDTVGQVSGGTRREALILSPSFEGACIPIGQDGDVDEVGRSL